MINLLKNKFYLHDDIINQLKNPPNKSTHQIIVEMLILTRKQNKIISFSDIYELGLGIDIIQVLNGLANHPDYKPPAYEEYINCFLFDFGLCYKEGCFIKSLIKTALELKSRPPILIVASCFYIGLNYLKKIPNTTTEIEIKQQIKDKFKCNEDLQCEFIYCYLKQQTSLKETTNKWANKQIKYFLYS